MGPEGRLELFVKAKQEINSIFSDSFKLLEEGSKLLCDINVENVRADLQLKDFRKEVSDLLERVSSITKVLARDQMKVAFFGSTSNGKSTTLNAMLQDQILPMGTGQTTNCLLSVHGSDQSCAYILEADSKIKWDVDVDVGAESSSKLADALRDGKLQQSSLVQVFWPKTRCKLLSEDVVLVDSPGIDVSPDLDQCIDKHCLDADVFVLVVNAESTLTMTEKNFFHKVNQRLSQPNIFILNNRWDVSELEPDTMEQVKIQHLQVEIGFLVNELKCVDKAQAEERVFFVSSKETLTTRMQKLKGMPREGGARHGEGFQARQMEFENFEMKLEECISKSAIKTKFGPHAMSGLKIAERMTDIMEQVEGLASQQRSLLEKNKKEQEDQFEDITRPLETCSAKVQSAIEEIQSTVKEQVADAMGETIGRLGSLVDKFNHPFHPYPSFVKTYIEDLLDYLETKLEGNVTACSLNSLTQLINNAQRHMAGCLENVLPQELPENVLQPDATSLDFQAIGKVDIRRLCDDFEFKADIDFHFGPEWLEKFLAPYLARLGNVLEANPQRSGRSFVSTAQYNTMSQSMEEVANSAQCVDAAPSIFTGLINLALHPGTWMAIAAAGLIFRPKYVLVILSFYGGKSIIQEWTTSAKAKALKRQFIEHVTERLRLAQSSISTNISNQVEQTLTSSLSKLKSLVQQETQSLEESVIEKQKKITTLETSESKATSLRNKASEVHSKLSQFKTVFGLA